MTFGSIDDQMKHIILLALNVIYVHGSEDDTGQKNLFSIFFKKDRALEKLLVSFSSILLNLCSTNDLKPTSGAWRCVWQ